MKISGICCFEFELSSNNWMLSRITKGQNLFEYFMFTESRWKISQIKCVRTNVYLSS